MFDAATAYEAYDVEVVDDPDDPTPRIAVGRVVTEELTMQVKLCGVWHRRLPDADRSACDVPFKAFGTECRREVLTNRDGGLCTDCFTRVELEHATANDARDRAEEERRRQREDIDSYFRPLIRRRTPSQGDR